MPQKQRRTTDRTGEALRFFDVKRTLREIDDDTRHDNPDYEQSDDEEDIDPPEAVSTTRISSPQDSESSASTTLPGEEPGSELDLSTRVVRELLADAPIPFDASGKYSTPKPVVPDVEEEEAGGSFELGKWI